MTESAARRWALGLLALLLGALAVVAVVGQLRGPQDGEAVTPTPGQVLLLGAPGLSFADIDPQVTPHLWAMLQDGASGTLVVRGTHEVTCPADGWLTLSAGQRASADTGDVQDCAAQPVLRLERGGTVVADWAAWQAAADDRPLAARLGILAETLEHEGRCVSATGPLAALGAAGPDGLARTEPDSCVVHLAGAVPVNEPSDAGAVDATLEGLQEQWGPDATIIVAGLSDDAALRPGLRAVLMTGPSVSPGLLTSTTTRQPGMVATTDLTATLLTLAGATVPDQVAGVPLAVLPASPEERGAEAAALRATDLNDLTRGVDSARTLPGPLLGTGAAALALVFLLAVRTDRRRAGLASGQPGATSSRTTASATARPPAQGAGAETGEPSYPGIATALVATGLLAVPSATFLAGLVPWWRAGPSGGVATALLCTVVLLGWIGMHLVAAWGGRWHRHPLGPPAVICALTIAVICGDVVLGGRLGLTSLLGVQPLAAGRFFGMGNVGIGIVATAALVLAGCLASMLHRRPVLAVTAVVAVGLSVAVIDGAPWWGADFGGVPALLLGTGVLAVAAAGLALTPARVLLIALVGAVGAAAVLLVDWLRPPESRTHLGRFVQSVLDGDGLGIVARKLGDSVGMLVDYPIAWVAVLLLALVVWALLAPASPAGRLTRQLWRVPLLRATAWAVVTLWCVGWALNDSGIAIVGVGMVIAVGAALAIGARIPRHRPRS